MRKNPRKLALVKFVGPRSGAKFKAEQVFVFLGEIANMPGHCVVADHFTGKIFSGYHTENFVELKDHEI